MTALTDKQLRALRAVAAPGSRLAHTFWSEARARWQGPRRTLGSLHSRGLVSYHDAGDGGHWTITDAGRAALAERNDPYA